MFSLFASCLMGRWDDVARDKQYVYEVQMYSLPGANMSFRIFKTKGAVR